MALLNDEPIIRHELNRTEEQLFLLGHVDFVLPWLETRLDGATGRFVELGYKLSLGVTDEDPALKLFGQEDPGRIPETR